jgi:hypothetical protein
MIRRRSHLHFLVKPGAGLQDTAISFFPVSLTLGTPVGTAAVIPLDGALAPTDTNINPDTAYYLEFNVTGLQTALQSDDSIVFTVSATHNDGDPGIAYIGAASFESVPEPQTGALLLGGASMLLAVHRLRRTFCF